MMFYYTFLLIVGNDINPSTIKEFRIWSVILFVGAFFEGYIIGNITAELSKAED